MKRIFYTKVLLALIFSAALFSTGCAKLKLQTSFQRSADTLDAHINKTAWQYMLSRSSGSDTTFKTMHDAIIYSGIDTNLYVQPGNTFFFLNANACKSVWNNILINGKKATSFRSYSKSDLKNYFLYLIVQGTYTHYNLPITPVTVQTMAPAGTYTANSPTFTIPLAGGLGTGTPIPANPNSTMTLFVLDALIGNAASYPIVVNMGIVNTATISATTQPNVTVYTSDILATNGVVDVMNGALWPVVYQ
jgi:hypothetical protein